MEKYRPRITTELTPLQMQTLVQILPHGMKKPLFQVLVDGIIELHSRGGHEAISAIVSKYVSVEQVANLGIMNLTETKIALLERKLQILKKEEGELS